MTRRHPVFLLKSIFCLTSTFFPFFSPMPALLRKMPDTVFPGKAILVVAHHILLHLVRWMHVLYICLSLLSEALAVHCKHSMSIRLYWNLCIIYRSYVGAQKELCLFFCSICACTANSCTLWYIFMCVYHSCLYHSGLDKDMEFCAIEMETW